MQDSRSSYKGSGPFASLQEEPDVLGKQHTQRIVISCVSNGRRAAYILCWGASGVKRAGASKVASALFFFRSMFWLPSVWQ